MSQLALAAAVFGLGCYHGINPGMGWLFAVALGLQERRGSAVAAAVPPLVIGHFVSIALIVVLVEVFAASFGRDNLRLASAVVLVAFGIYRLVRARHPRWAGMRVGFWGLGWWAFLMATAHGAGLMLAPFVLGDPMTASSTMPAMRAMPAVDPAFGALLIGVHTAGYFLVLVVAAFVVYRYIGVGILRKTWFNLDLVWAVALLVTGAFALVV